MCLGFVPFNLGLLCRMKIQGCYYHHHHHYQDLYHCLCGHDSKQSGEVADEFAVDALGL